MPREGHNVPHQDVPEPLSLIGVDDRKGHFGLAAAELDVSRAGYDRLLSVFVDLGNDCDVIHEIHVEKEVDLFFGEFAARTEKAPGQRLRTRSIDRGQHRIAIIRANRTDEDCAPVSQNFGRKKSRGCCHGR